MSAFIELQRTAPGMSTDTSSLELTEHYVRVVGVLPHGTCLTFEPAEARKLRDWLDRHYAEPRT